MSEPRTYPGEPVGLPVRMDPEPKPVPGCSGCAELAIVRGRARAGGDMTTVTDCNVYLRRHPEGH